MNNTEYNLLLKEKMQQHVPPRPVQILHGGVIVLVSIAIGVFSLSAGADTHQGIEAWLGVILAAAGLALYVMWIRIRSDQARKEARAEYLAASTDQLKS